MLSDDEKSMLTYLCWAIRVAPDMSSTLINIVEKRDISDCARNELKVLRSTEDMMEGVFELADRIIASRTVQ